MSKIFYKRHVRITDSGYKLIGSFFIFVLVLVPIWVDDVGVKGIFSYSIFCIYLVYLFQVLHEPLSTEGVFDIKYVRLKK